MSSPASTASVKAVLFDLDGTLVDTAPDLAHALNCVLDDESRPPLPFANIRPAVSLGSSALIQLGFGNDPAHHEQRRQALLVHYAENLTRRSRLFSGMEAVLDQLEDTDTRWGIVTNKPARFTDPLCRALGLTDRTDCVVSGDSTPHSKPHPAPLLAAADRMGVHPSACVYIGDAKTDVQAGRQAGMATLVALFGYIGDDQDPHSWGATGAVHSPPEILQWLPTCQLP